MNPIVIATRNLHKLYEIKMMLKGIDAKFFSISDFENAKETVEDGTSFEENALKKAKESVAYTDLFSIADDSGLMVDYLNGEPGIFSSRFAPTDSERIEKLLGLMEYVPWDKRGATFVCTVAVYDPSGGYRLTRGEVRGYISYAPHGKSGFGYDPIFFYPELNKTFAELGEQKQRISHRTRAFTALKKILKDFYKF